MEPEDGGWGGEPEKVEQPQEKPSTEAEQPESKDDKESKPASKTEVNHASDSKPTPIAGPVKAESVSSKQGSEHNTPKSVAPSIREPSAPPSQGASSPRPFAQPFTPRTVQNSLLFASPVQRHISPAPSIVSAGYLDGRVSPFTPGYISPLAAPGPYSIAAAPIGVPPVPDYSAPVPVIPQLSARPSSPPVPDTLSLPSRTLECPSRHLMVHLSFHLLDPMHRCLQARPWPPSPSLGTMKSPMYLLGKKAATTSR